VSALPEEVILLCTGDGRVIIVLSDPKAQSDLVKHLETVLAFSVKPVVEV
jgi:hypothetical protein